MKASDAIVIAKAITNAIQRDGYIGPISGLDWADFANGLDNAFEIALENEEDDDA